MHTRILVLSLVAALVVPAIGTIAVADTPPPPGQAQTQAAGGYLGVMLEPVPGALRAQLGDALPPGQGVMVGDVAPDSPAEKAGLKAYDILTVYDDQKLYSAEQLTHLVRAERPDTTVDLSVVRGGATEHRQVTLGEIRATTEFRLPDIFPETGRMHRHHRPHYARPPGADNWESFDSMSLKKLEDGTFKAEIRFLDEDGKLVKQEFTGSRDAIRDQVLALKDIPRAERHQLLNALSARDRFMPPARWFGPGFYPQEWFNWQPDF